MDEALFCPRQGVSYSKLGTPGTRRPRTAPTLRRMRMTLSAMALRDAEIRYPAPSSPRPRSTSAKGAAPKGPAPKVAAPRSAEASGWLLSLMIAALAFATVATSLALFR